MFTLKTPFNVFKTSKISNLDLISLTLFQPLLKIFRI